MIIKLNLIQITILLGALQGIFLSLVLMISGRHKPEKFIGWALLIFTFNLIGFVFADVEIYRSYPQLIFLPFSQFLLIGPFFYLYFKSKLTKELNYNEYFWLIPGAVEILIQMVLFFNNAEDKIYISRNIWYYIYAGIENAIGIGYNIFFLIKCIKLLKMHQSNLLQNVSNWAHFKILDFKWLLISLSVLILLWMVLFLTDVFVFNFLMLYRHYYPVYILMSVFIYWLGYKCFFRRNEATIAVEAYSLIKPKNHLEEKIIDQQIIEKILTHFEIEKPYIDADLNLNILADQLQMTQKELSNLINVHFKKNFNDFINHYRIEEVKNKLANPENEKFTILSLALDAGFNSKSSFNRVFKNYTGLTPKAFKESLNGGIK